MKANRATCVAFLCVCLVQSSYGRLSVFRQDITGIPGVEGQSYTVVHDGPNGPEQVARLHAFLSTDQQAPSVIDGLFPTPLEWVSRQFDLVHAFQSQLLLDSPPDATAPTPLEDDMSMEGLLKRVKCQRMRQAMVDDANAQRMWLEPGMSSSVSHPASGLTEPEPTVGAGMADDLVAPLNDIYRTEPATTTQTECFDNAGLPVPCDFDETKSVAPWDTLELPAGASVTSEDEGEQTDLLPGSTWQMREGEEGETGEGSMWETEEREAEEVEGRLGDEDVDEDEIDDMDDMEEDEGEDGERPRSAWGRVAMEGSDEGMMDDDDAEWVRDERFRHPHGDMEDDDDEGFEHPPPPPMLLVVAGALVAVGLGCLLLKALRKMHSRCGAGHGWKCCRWGREQFLQAPLLHTDVYGVKVAAVEAADDDVKGIDTSVALLKGEPSGLSR